MHFESVPVLHASPLSYVSWMINESKLLLDGFCYNLQEVG
jgi:hypothetical protein